MPIYADDYIPVIKYNGLNVKSSGAATMKIGDAPITVSANPAKITISSDSNWFHVLDIFGRKNSYLGMQICNQNGGTLSSSDYIAAADNSSVANDHYVDFGINSSLGADVPFTTANEGYIYCIDSTFNIGALGTTGQIKFYTTGGTSPVLQCRISNTGVFFPKAAATVSAPAYVLGGMYYDTTLNKLRIGGATAWETVTSA